MLRAQPLLAVVEQTRLGLTDCGLRFFSRAWKVDGAVESSREF